MARGRTVVVGAAVVVAALLIANKARATSEPPPDTITVPTEEEILSSASLPALDDYYDQLSLLYRSYKITQEEYTALYDAYEQRFFELWEELSTTVS